MNYDLLFAIIFYGLIFLYYLKNKKKFQVQGILVLYKTKLGIKAMKKVSKYFPNFWRTLGVIGIYVGFLGMLFILYFLVKGTIDLIFVPGAPPAVAPVLPGVKIPGLPILSFWHWIIGILVVAVIHEFSHGIFSKLYKIKVKSSGFAFLGPILAAFVEPDEKQLKKSSTKAQLSVLAAGPFSNIVTAFIVLLLVQLT